MQRLIKKKKKGQLLVLALNACPTSQSLCERHLEIFSLAQAVKGDAPEGSSLLNRNNDKIKACSYMFFQQQSAAPGWQSWNTQQALSSGFCVNFKFKKKIKAARKNKQTTKSKQKPHISCKPVSDSGIPAFFASQETKRSLGFISRKLVLSIKMNHTKFESTCSSFLEETVCCWSLQCFEAAMELKKKKKRLQLLWSVSFTFCFYFFLLFD